MMTLLSVELMMVNSDHIPLNLDNKNTYSECIGGYRLVIMP
jgi:hypothetical protein